MKPPSRAPPDLKQDALTVLDNSLSSGSAVLPVTPQLIFPEGRCQRTGVQRSWWRSGRRGLRMRQAECDAQSAVASRKSQDLQK